MRTPSTPHTGAPALANVRSLATRSNTAVANCCPRPRSRSSYHRAASSLVERFGLETDLRGSPVGEGGVDPGPSGVNIDADRLARSDMLDAPLDVAGHCAPSSGDASRSGPSRLANSSSATRARSSSGSASASRSTDWAFELMPRGYIGTANCRRWCWPTLAAPVPTARAPFATNWLLVRSVLHTVVSNPHHRPRGERCRRSIYERI